jgi:hypothetical protein
MRPIKRMPGVRLMAEIKKTAPKIGHQRFPIGSKKSILAIPAELCKGNL